MPGEQRFRLLDLEPTRALGHKGKAYEPMHYPEIYQWCVQKPEASMLLLVCDGFFSKDAFRSTAHLTAFLADPTEFCHRADFFDGSCMEALMHQLREPLPNPSKYSMASLFKFIYRAVNSKLSDDAWKDAHHTAYQYLAAFAQQRPTPNIRTAPAQTLAAAAYLATLMVSDDNVSATLVILDQHKLYHTPSFQLSTTEH
jgi:hypothetical protein